jgi:hypothetical protein
MVTLVKDDSFYSVELGRMCSGKTWTIGGHTLDWDSESGLFSIDRITLRDDCHDLDTAADCVSDYANSLLG